MTGVTDRDTESAGKGLFGSSAVMAAGTLVSRITGFVKSLFLVYALGSLLFADTFNLANTIPTSIYILVAGGALNAVFVPQLVRAMKTDEDGGEAFGQRLLTATTLLLAAASALAVLAAPLLVQLYASPKLLEPDNQAYYELTVTFARFCLPQIFFFGIYVILGQILNARGNFGPMMWAPILNNLVQISVFALYIVIHQGRQAPGDITSGEIALLGLGTTAGIAIQAVVLIPVLRRTGFRLRARFDFRGGGIGTSGKLAIWTVGFVLVNQIWFVVASRFATGASAQARDQNLDVGVGLTPYLQAFLIFQLPHAVVAVSLVTALLPRMSRSAADARPHEVAADISQGLRSLAVAMLPAAAAFLALGPTMAVALFYRGGMSHASAEYIGFVLMGFAPGLLGFCSQYMILRGFYSYEDTRTPVFIQLAVVAASSLTAGLAYAVLPVQWKTVGIAVAYGVGYWVGFGLGQATLRKRVGSIQGRAVLQTYARAGCAALLSGLMAFAASWSLVVLLGPGPWAALLATVAGGGMLMVAYFLFGKVFSVRELDDLVAIIRRRAGR